VVLNALLYNHLLLLRFFAIRTCWCFARLCFSCRVLVSTLLALLQDVQMAAGVQLPGHVCDARVPGAV